jgi:hypothetical protein
VLLTFSGGEYNVSNESLNGNEDNVANSCNSKDMRQKEASPIRRSSWHEKGCDFLDLESVFLVRGCVTIIFDPKESILGNILQDDHIGLTIIYYPKNISTLMIIWKWLLVQITMEGFSLKELLFSYDDCYVPKVDVNE